MNEKEKIEEDNEINDDNSLFHAPWPLLIAIGVIVLLMIACIIVIVSLK